MIKLREEEYGRIYSRLVDVKRAAKELDESSDIMINSTEKYKKECKGILNLLNPTCIYFQKEISEKIKDNEEAEKKFYGAVVRFADTTKNIFEKIETERKMKGIR